MSRLCVPLHAGFPFTNLLQTSYADETTLAAFGFKMAQTLKQSTSKQTVKNKRKAIMMKTNNFAAIGSAALVTATLTVALFLPGFLNAGNGGDSATVTIAQPKLISHGVQFTLTAAGNQAFKAGDAPEFELKAINSTSQATDVSVRISMTSSAPPNRMSRMVMLPAKLWEKTCPLTLNPNETKTVALKTDTKLPANSMIEVLLVPVGENASTAPAAQRPNSGGFIPANGSSAIVALSYSTLVLKLQPSATASKQPRDELSYSSLVITPQSAAAVSTQPRSK
jgi:hypothetical protein